MSVNPLYPALLSAQGEFSAVVKNKQNPHLKNFYADLSAVLEAVTDPLATHGLLIVQRFAHEQGTPVLITELIHAESGQSISSELPIVSKDPSDPQKLGGAITYARRYSLLALLGLSPEDDDGNAAAQPRQQSTPRQDTSQRQTTQQRPVQAATAASEAVKAEPLTEDQDKAIATIRDEAEAGLSYAGAGERIMDLRAAATDGQWVTLKARFMAIRKQFYPDSVKPHPGYVAEGATR